MYKCVFILLMCSDAPSTRCVCICGSSHDSSHEFSFFPNESSTHHPQDDDFIRVTGAVCLEDVIRDVDDQAIFPISERPIFNSKCREVTVVDVSQPPTDFREAVQLIAEAVHGKDDMHTCLKPSMFRKATKAPLRSRHR